METSSPGPGAREARLKQISTWHAQAHDRLDRAQVPRFEGGEELTLVERIDRIFLTVPNTPKPPVQVGSLPEGTNDE